MAKSANYDKLWSLPIEGEVLTNMILGKHFDNIEEDEVYTLTFYEPKETTEEDKEVFECGYMAVVYFNIECDDWESNIVRVKYNTSSPFALELCNLEYDMPEEDEDED